MQDILIAASLPTFQSVIFVIHQLHVRLLTYETAGSLFL